ncbi:hypothetical protein JCM15519_06820 [Fundidesulfovibrio butyratiphilus]
MPGIRISVDISRGTSSLSEFRQALKESGAESKLTENEIKRLEERFKQKLQADKAASALDQFTRSAGLSAKEAQGLSVSLGLASDAAKKLSVGQDALAKTISDLDAKLASLNAVVTKTSAAFSSFKFDEVANQSSKLASSLGATSDAAKKLAQSKEDLARSAGALDSKTQGLTGSIGSAVLKIGALATAYISLREAMRGVKGFVEMGIGFNSSIESAQLGIASVLSATQNIANAEGRRLSGMEKLNAAQAISRDLMKDIQRMGLETTATTQQLVDGFQALVGPATSAGLTLDQAKDTMVGIVQAFAALKIPMEQLSAEARSLFDGDIKLGQDRLAGVLGITKEMVLTWQRQGTYVENLNKKLEFFRLAGAESAKTWAGLASNTKEVLEVFAGSATQGLFTGAKQAMSEFAAFALDTKNAGLGGEMQQISAGMREIGEYLGKELVSLTREFIDYLKSASKDFDADEVRKKMEEIGKSAKETASAVGNVAVAVGKLLNTTLTGWNSLPEPIRDVGLVAALIGGAKIRAAIVGLATAVGYVKELWQYASNIASLDNPGAVAGIKRADFNISRIDEDISNAKGFLNANGRFVSKDKEIELLKKQKEYWEDWKKGAKSALIAEKEVAGVYSTERASAEKAFADGSVPKGAGYKVSPIVDKAKEQGEKEAKEYTDEYLKGWAKGTTNKKERASRERDKAIWELMDDYNSGKYGKGEKGLERFNSLKGIIDNEYNAAIEATEKGGKGVAKADAEAVKLINEARGKAQAAEANLLGDPWGQKEAQATTEYQKSLDELNVKLAGYKGTQKEALSEGLKYWAEYEYGIKKAQIAYDAWKEDMTFWANNLKFVGQMSFDPSKTMAGDTMGIDQQTTDTQRQIDSRASAQARRIWDDAVEASRKDGADISAIWAGVNDKWLATEKRRLDQTEANNQEAELKKVKLHEDNLGDLAKLDDAYQARREEGFKNLEKALRELGVSETHIAQEVSLKKDKNAKEFLETRLQYENSFSDYLSDALALQYGAYKSAYGKQLDLWKQYSDSIIKLFDGISDAIGSTFGDALGDVITGQFKGIESYTTSLLNSLKQAFSQWITEMVKLAVLNPIKVSILASITESSSDSSSSSLLSSIKSLGNKISNTDSLGDTWSSITDLFSAGSVAADADTVVSSLASGEALVDTTGIFSSSFTEATASAASAIESAGGLSLSAIEGAGTAALDATAAAATTTTAAATTLGSTLAAAVPVVGAVGALVGLGVSLFGSTGQTSTTWTNLPGSQAAIALYNGQLVTGSYGTTKTTTSGMFGSSSTSHAIWFSQADAEMAAQEEAAWEEATAGLTSFTDALGLSDEQIAKASEGFTSDFMSTSVTDAYGILSNMLAKYIADNLGMGEDLASVVQSDESYQDALSRLATALTGMDSIARATGFDFDNLTAGMSKLKAADYVSQLADSVGSLEGVQTALGLLVEHTTDDAGLIRAQIAQTEQSVSPTLSKLGTDIENFWSAFDAATANGAIDPDVFAEWADAASKVDSIDTLTDSLEDAENAALQTASGIRQFQLSLEARFLTAQGLTYQASIVSMLASQEQELTQARVDGYDAATIARLAEVQQMEMAALVAQHAEEYADAVRSAESRIADALGDTAAAIAAQVAENERALVELTKTYDWSPGSSEEYLFIATWRAQTLELVNTIQEVAEATAKATESMRLDLDARQATIAGYDQEASAIQKVASFTNELTQAYENGLDSDLISELVQTQLDELAKYWSDTISDMKTALNDLYATQSSLLGTLTGNTQTAVQQLYALFDRYNAGETDLADSIVSSLESIASAVSSMVESINSTISSIRTGDDSTQTADVKAATAKSYFDEQYAAAAAGDTTAMSNVTSYATQYLTALKSSTADASVYQTGVDYVTNLLGKLASGATSTTSGLTDIATQVTNDQIGEAETALKQAEVAQLKTTYETLYGQALAAFKDSYAGTYTSGMAATGAGWQTVSDMFNVYAPYNVSQLQRILNGSLSWADYVGWFMNAYGTGSGYVDWDSAIALWASKSALPGNVSALYSQAQDAYTSWQDLKSQYGFAFGGVVSTGTTSGDNTMLFANNGERVLTAQQNRAFEALVYGSGDNSLIKDLLAEIAALRQEVRDLRRANTEENRGIAGQVLSLNRRTDEWTVNGLKTKSDDESAIRTTVDNWDAEGLPATREEATA